MDDLSTSGGKVDPDQINILANSAPAINPDLDNDDDSVGPISQNRPVKPDPAEYISELENSDNAE